MIDAARRTRGRERRSGTGTDATMLFDLLHHCFGLDCREVAMAAWAGLSTTVYYLSHAASRL